MTSVTTAGVGQQQSLTGTGWVLPPGYLMLKACVGGVGRGLVAATAHISQHNNSIKAEVCCFALYASGCNLWCTSPGQLHLLPGQGRHSPITTYHALRYYF